MLAVGLVPLLIVAEQGRSGAGAPPASLVCYVVGGVGLLLFVSIERWYGDDALLPLRLFRNSVFSLVTLDRRDRRHGDVRRDRRAAAVPADRARGVADRVAAC